MRDLQIETTWYLPCNCDNYTDSWERVEAVEEGSDYFGYRVDGELVYEPPCTRELALYADLACITEDHSGLKAGCILPTALCAELGRLLKLSESNSLTEESDYEICLSISDERGCWITLDQGDLYVGGPFNELSIVMDDSLFGAFQQAFVAHGAQVLTEEEAWFSH